MGYIGLDSGNSFANIRLLSCQVCHLLDIWIEYATSRGSHSLTPLLFNCVRTSSAVIELYRRITQRPCADQCSVHFGEIATITQLQCCRTCFTLDILPRFIKLMLKVKFNSILSEDCVFIVNDCRIGSRGSNSDLRTIMNDNYL